MKHYYSLLHTITEKYTGGKHCSIVELDFSLTGEVHEGKYRVWHHRITEKEYTQFMTQSKNGYDTR